jgi:hypothetical protein
MSDSEQEEQAPQAKVRAPNRHRFKTVSQRIDEVRNRSARCCSSLGNLLAAALLLLLQPGGGSSSSSSSIITRSSKIFADAT